MTKKSLVCSWEVLASNLTPCLGPLTLRLTTLMSSMGCFCCSVAKSCPTLSNLMDCSMPGFPIHPSLSSGICSNSCPLSRWFYLTISSSAALFSFSLQSFPASESFPKCQLFASGSQSVGVSASASVLPMNIHDWFSLVVNWLVWSSCPRDSQESSPAPQFESINSLALSFLYGPTLFNFMAAVTIHSDLGACENKIYHCFHVCPFYLPLVMSCHIMTCHIMDATILVFFNVEFQASFFNSFLSPTSRG